MEAVRQNNTFPERVPSRSLPSHCATSIGNIDMDSALSLKFASTACLSISGISGTDIAEQESGYNRIRNTHILAGNSAPVDTQLELGFGGLSIGASARLQPCEPGQVDR